MVDAFGTTGMIVLAVLALVAIYILMRLMGRPSGDEGEQDEVPASPAEKRPAMISDEDFIESYTGPMLEDALETLEEAVDSARAGLEYYKRSAWEAAGEEFHSAVKGIDSASERLKEVVAMVEDPGSRPAKQAKARMDECRQLRALTIRMEEACDARVDGKEGDASGLEGAMPGLERLASSFKK